jgi:hypothetical protein
MVLRFKMSDHPTITDDWIMIGRFFFGNSTTLCSLGYMSRFRCCRNISTNYGNRNNSTFILSGSFVHILYGIHSTWNANLADEEIL